MKLKIVGGVLLGLVVLAMLGWGLFYRYPLWFADQQIRWHLRRAGVRSEYVTVDGHRIHLFEARPPAGMRRRLWCWCMGWARGEDWSAIIPALAEAGFHVYAPDLLGYGRSERPDVAYTISTEEKIVADFMQVEGVPRADVGGWSMVGWVSMKLALDHPAMVDRLAVL